MLASRLLTDINSCMRIFSFESELSWMGKIIVMENIIVMFSMVFTADLCNIMLTLVIF